MAPKTKTKEPIMDRLSRDMINEKTLDAVIRESDFNTLTRTNEDQPCRTQQEIDPDEPCGCEAKGDCGCIPDRCSCPVCSFTFDRDVVHYVCCGQTRFGQRFPDVDWGIEENIYERPKRPNDKRNKKIAAVTGHVIGCPAALAVLDGRLKPAAIKEVFNDLAMRQLLVSYGLIKCAEPWVQKEYLCVKCKSYAPGSPTEATKKSLCADCRDMAIRKWMRSKIAASAKRASSTTTAKDSADTQTPSASASAPSPSASAPSPSASASSPPPIKDTKKHSLDNAYDGRVERDAKRAKVSAI
jgi:hypothetical protein